MSANHEQHLEYRTFNTGTPGDGPQFKIHNAQLVTLKLDILQNFRQNPPVH